MIESSAKDFNKHPELLDVHVERVKRANEAARRYMVDSPLFTTGIIYHEDFLGADAAQRVLDEVKQIRPGDAKRADSLVSAAPGTASEACAGRMWKAIGGLFRHHKSEARNRFEGSTYRQHIYNEPDDGDIQKVYHCDTFFPALKYWYFPHAVEEGDGPLMYVPNSPVLTDGLLAWHAEQVAKIKAGQHEGWRGKSHKEGSLRISEDELADLGLTPMPVTVKPDTFIIVNVFGFHRRGDTTKPTHRYSIHGSIRISRPLEPGA